MNIALADNQALADFSRVLALSAMAVYALAFVAHIAEWVFGSRSKVARTAAALSPKKQSPYSKSVEEIRAAENGGGTAVLEKPKVVSRATVGGRPDLPDGPGAAGGDAQGDTFGRIAIALTGLAFAIHLAAVVTRAVSVTRAPWANMYEFSLTFSMVVVGAYLALLIAKKNVRWVGLILVTTVLLDLGLASTVLYTESDQLPPALDSAWLWIHVSLAIVCGALFYLGAVGTVLYLFRDGYEAKLERGGKPGAFSTSVLERLPSAATLDKFAYRVNAAVFPFWTFTIIAGAIWAEDAWGRYWGWDAKEVWSFITWVAYAGYLHARATVGWKGRRAAMLAIIAFLCFLFNYYGVNLFVNSLHSYSGV
ncbi:c-type cytochrome biogenesis protein CcsB [Streptomyces durbertensis]|uniref:C-type cytochrome biogenesis protein CcsB n=1 Tax=Streptomyces durbertensis TaxID=2448886 RepID=A0ABR6EFE5_9ACTN|nr:c-type cytochrome biogenesis protein CcsB [Streptomyces durbertensis]MBB1244068.1 c-type cytochrome biogenesis protein CcsB [Streptomyces durbertensis]